MGLDMYLTARNYLWFSGKESTKISKLFPKVKLKPKEIIFEAMYWRKANMIHKWFVENVQDGKDDCGDYYVSRKDLKKLLDVVTKVLEGKNTKLLPTAEGFFFGGTEYDEYYWGELERTKKELKLLLEDKALDSFEFYYHSSW